MLKTKKTDNDGAVQASDIKDEYREQSARLDSEGIPPNVDLGLAEGTPRSAHESPLRDWEGLFMAMPDPAVVLNLDGIVEAANRRFFLMSGFSSKDVIGKPFSDFVIWRDQTLSPADQERKVSRYIVQAIVESERSDSWELSCKRKSGGAMPIIFTGSPVINEDGNITGIIGTGRDMTEINILQAKLDEVTDKLRQCDESIDDRMSDRMQEVKQRTRMLEELSVTDELTKLFNRRYLFKRANEEIQRSARYGTSFSLVIIDIDHFKRINDTYGHQAGDMVLYELAGILQGSVRQMDVVARTGGEEFIILLPSIREGHAFLFCERLREKVGAFQFTFLPEGRFVNISLGISDYPREGIDDIDALIRLADRALYRAKETRNATVCSSNLPEEPDDPTHEHGIK